MEIVQVVRLTVEGDTYEGEVDDLEKVKHLTKLEDAYNKSKKALEDALDEYGIGPAVTAGPSFTVRPSVGKRGAVSSGPDAADVRAWAATLTKPSLPLSAQGRIPGWVNTAFEKKLKGEALGKHVQEHASTDFLKKFEDANKK
ncbi:hypothetical protein DWB77_02080 [Streptomyces hundungensis]|uniref:Nucleoid-associated protein Lsr2 n=1 Tax=Streptomyces hundungensis TaxID=1077946 RepID=A0A387HBA6_9ACTN|nr:hypothetical protein [Streptomyces hundungensis]AYG79961.1 hypothetical protein DWB77_02080 [Streptomyces hundungensis]